MTAGEGVEEKEPSYTVGGDVNWCSRYGKQYEGSQNVKNRITIISSNFTVGYLSKKTKTLIQKDTFTPMFTAVLQ